MLRENLLGTPLRRKIAAGVTAASLIAAGGVAAGLVDLRFSRPTEANLLRLPDNPQAADIDMNLQQFVAPRLTTFLRNLGQLHYESDGVVRLPNSGITIHISGNGQQIDVQKLENVNGNTKNTAIGFQYKPGSDTEILAVTAATRVLEGIPPTVTADGSNVVLANSIRGLRVNTDPDGKPIGDLYIEDGDTRHLLTTDPVSTVPLQLRQQDLQEFNRTLTNTLNAIDTGENANAAGVELKVEEWKDKIMASPDREILDVYDGITRTRIKVQSDDGQISYEIVLGVDVDNQFKTMTVIKSEKGQPFVENEYTVEREDNDEDLSMFRIRFEDGDGARGTFEQFGTTDPSSTQRLTETQFESWAQNIDSIINAVAAA